MAVTKAEGLFLLQKGYTAIPAKYGNAGLRSVLHCIYLLVLTYAFYFACVWELTANCLQDMKNAFFLFFLPAIVEKAIAACLGGAQTGGDGDLWQHGLIAQAMHRYNSVQSVSLLRCGEIFYQL